MVDVRRAIHCESHDLRIKIARIPVRRITQSENTNLHSFLNPGDTHGFPMDCLICSCILELDSLEYRWHGNMVEARSTFSYSYTRQVWIKAGRELVRAIALTEVEPG